MKKSAVGNQVDREQELRDVRRALAYKPPLIPKTVAEEDSMVAVLKGAPKGGKLFCVALNEAPPRVIIRAAKECVLYPATAIVNRQRFALLLDHVVKVLAQEPHMELAEIGKEAA